MTIKLYNTKTKSKDEFEPLDAKNVRMYVCGPTVYDRAHLGNARPVVVFDTLFRLLRHTYGADHVTYVRNFTDVDDKINAKAAETGRSIADITDETIGWYHDDMDALGALRPTQEPRATAFIPQMVSMIETLIARGHAYADGAGHVLFAVRSYDEYGALARRSLDDMRAGARVEIADNKRDPMDFVLWKPSTEDQPGWDSPWGKGRPGWHIECSAMAYELLGDSFDIHGGGIDLAFPHHENEVAQSMCSHPEGEFAKIWMHNGFLQVEGEKMSKSLGNFFTVKDLLDKNVPGEAMRFVLLSAHYRQPIDYRRKLVGNATSTLRKWRVQTKNVRPDMEPSQLVLDALSNDLNTPEAIKVLHQLSDDGEYGTLLASAQLFGLLTDELAGWDTIDELDQNTNDQVNRLVRVWEKAVAVSDYELSDKLRALLFSAGVEVDLNSEPKWKVGFSHYLTGWSDLYMLADRGQLKDSLATYQSLANTRRIVFAKSGKKMKASSDGFPNSIDFHLIERAEREVSQ